MKKEKEKEKEKASKTAEAVVTPSASTPVTIESLKKSAREEFLEYMGRHVRLGEEIRELEAERKVIGEEMLGAMREAGVGALKENGITVRRSEGSRSVVKPELLLEQGVSPKAIKKATVTTTFERLTVTAEKKKESGGGGRVEGSEERGED